MNVKSMTSRIIILETVLLSRYLEVFLEKKNHLSCVNEGFVFAFFFLNEN